MFVGLLTGGPAEVLFRVSVGESNPDAVVLPPEGVQSRHDKLVRLQVVDFNQLSTVLPACNSRIHLALPSSEQEAFEKCWAHSQLRAAARRTPHCHSPGVAIVASHAACASMSTTTTTTTTTRDRGDRYGPMEWAQLATRQAYALKIKRLRNKLFRVECMDLKPQLTQSVNQS